jgi:signal peptidase I
VPEIDSKANAEGSSASGHAGATSRAKWWISELISLAVVLAAVTAARSSLADHYYVPSGSMQNT